MNKEEIKNALSEVLKENFGSGLDKNTHRQHHDFISEMMGWGSTIKSTVIKTIIKSAITGMIILLILGFVFWGKGQFK